MMEFLTKSAAWITIFYLFYRLFLVRETFYRLNRILLLLGIVLSLVLPAVSFTGWFSRQSVVKDVVKVYFKPEVSQNVATPAVINNKPVAVVAMQQPSLGSNVGWLLVAYFLGFTIMLLLLLYNLVRILLVRQRASYLQINGTRIYEVEADSAAFTFFRWIFLNPSMVNKEDVVQIIEHERIHARKLHSVDLMLAELIRAVLWFNPLAWLYKRLVAQNLEFETDNVILQKGYNRKLYQYSLLNASVSKGGFALVSSFNINHLKTRIAMMNKKRSSKVSMVKMLLMLPVALMVALVLCFSDVRARIASSYQKEKIKKEAVVFDKKKGKDSKFQLECTNVIANKNSTVMYDKVKFTAIVCKNSKAASVDNGFIVVDGQRAQDRVLSRISGRTFEILTIYKKDLIGINLSDNAEHTACFLFTESYCNHNRLKNENDFFLDGDVRYILNGVVTSKENLSSVMSKSVVSYDFVKPNADTLGVKVTPKTLLLIITTK
ncbi:M56 family metallopeptidase [Acetobacteroides hydrogenigenes]|uniref:Beta-lactamase regulating signal transducer with metallopeptidase domain n=1 Tax=Acetobacteroides hydrogenigenes TaxID=979970 RepID=A0A4V2RPH8_9BACT|nr:M56 family metallopeptidase [Acetobacteroides hydrogenigenes]TCN67670.1 beta-lactamase regulating signal transducer with metallopeptidase domain [Acetobacteroides hydrogenigenes]